MFPDLMLYLIGLFRAGTVRRPWRENDDPFAPSSGPDTTLTSAPCGPVQTTFFFIVRITLAIRWPETSFPDRSNGLERWKNGAQEAWAES
jgi:hypothetical protein